LPEINHDSNYPYQFNPQASHKGNKFIPDTTAGTPGHWALLLAGEKGRSNIPGARVDVLLILEPAVRNKSIGRRYGYVEQFYREGDDYIWFPGPDGEIRKMAIF
jgi:hypothetical protein